MLNAAGRPGHLCANALANYWVATQHTCSKVLNDAVVAVINVGVPKSLPYQCLTPKQRPSILQRRGNINGFERVWRPAVAVDSERQNAQGTEWDS